MEARTRGQKEARTQTKNWRKGAEPTRERENQTKQRGKTEEKLGRVNREKRPGT
jgi:hypothetical protein